MKLKQTTTIAVLLLMVASLFIAGCTNLNSPATSSPSPTVSPSPATTATSTPGPTNALGVNATIAALTKGLTNTGNTIIEPFTASTNSLGNTVLTAKYRSTTGDVSTEKVELCKNSSNLETRFQALISDAKARGFSGDLNADGYWNGSDANTGKVITLAKSNSSLYVISIEN
jgi:hypothetical protein